jgi:TonB family protein
LAHSRRSLCSLFLLAVFAAGSGMALAGGRRAIVSKVAPVYPELARRMHVSGIVVLELTVAPDGSVTDAKVESGHALLGGAAQDAVRRWRFEPAAETTSMTVDVNFANQ